MLCYVFSTSEGLIWSNRCCAFPSEGVRLKPGHKGETVSELPASQASRLTRPLFSSHPLSHVRDCGCCFFTFQTGSFP